MSTAAKKRKVIDIVPPTHSEECRMLWTRQRSCGHGVFWCSICRMDYNDDDIRCLHPIKTKHRLVRT